MATPGDERQKNDATFNAGLNSGTSYEYEDTANRLHFYILDKRTDAQGILHYKVGIKSLDGAGPQTRGVSLASPQLGTAEGYSTCTFDLKNTGAAAAVPERAPAGRLGVPGQRHLPPLRPRRAARAGRRTSRTRSRPPSSASRSPSRSTSRRAPAPARSP